MKTPNFSRATRRLFGGMSILLIVLLLNGCALPFLSGEADQPDPAYNNGADDEDSGSQEDFPIVPLIPSGCPKENTQYQLILNHWFRYSPNQMVNQYVAYGNLVTEAPYNVFGLVEIEDQLVYMEPISFEYEYEGFIANEDGRCTIEGDGEAMMEIMGTCEDGIVTLNIRENMIATGNRGTMDCGVGMLISWHVPYPQTNVTLEFFIAQGGYTRTEIYDADATNSFKVFKIWTLVPVGIPPEEP